MGCGDSKFRFYTKGNAGVNKLPSNLIQKVIEFLRNFNEQIKNTQESEIRELGSFVDRFVPTSAKTEQMKLELQNLFREKVSKDFVEQTFKQELKDIFAKLAAHE